MTPGRHGLQGIAPGQYGSPSGRYLVEHDESMENECECIHCQDGRQHDCRSPIPGQRIDRGWHVWDDVAGDYARGSGYQSFDTLKEAAAYALQQERFDALIGPRLRNGNFSSRQDWRFA